MYTYIIFIVPVLHNNPCTLRIQGNYKKIFQLATEDNEMTVLTTGLPVNLQLTPS